MRNKQAGQFAPPAVLAAHMSIISHRQLFVGTTYSSMAPSLADILYVNTANINARMWTWNDLHHLGM